MSAQLALAPIKVPQIVAVKALLDSGEWWTLRQLRDGCFNRYAVGISEASVSARLRDLRHPKYGGYTIDRRPTERKGIFVYRLRQDRSNV